MTPEEQLAEEEKAAAAAAEQKAREDAEAEALANQDPLQNELEKVKRKKTPEEKLLFKKREIDRQVKELGLDSEEEDDDDEKPLTRGEFKKMQSQQAKKTALELAEDISNETERELVIYHLENTIRSTGNPQDDLKLARALVNSAKNSKIIEESYRKPTAKNHSSGGGSPKREDKPEEELTAEEKTYTLPPWNMSKTDILKAREGGLKPKFDKKV